MIMQSLNRAIKRGNAVVALNTVTKTTYVQYKKGATKARMKGIDGVWRLVDEWKTAKDNEVSYQKVTKPLNRLMVADASIKGLRNIVNVD